MSDATLRDYEQLAASVISNQTPILPKPRWGQNAAFIAFYIDKLRAENEELQKSFDQTYEMLKAEIAENEELRRLSHSRNKV